MGFALNEEIRRLLDGRHFAVLATINPDGGPQTSAMWVGRDGDEVLFSTVAGRRARRISGARSTPDSRGSTTGAIPTRILPTRSGSSCEWSSTRRRATRRDLRRAFL